jgi:hypothetical protein
MYQVKTAGRGGRRPGSGRRPGTKNRPETTAAASAARTLDLAARALFDAAAGEGGDAESYRLAAKVIAGLSVYLRSRVLAERARLGRSAPAAGEEAAAVAAPSVL